MFLTTIVTVLVTLTLFFIISWYLLMLKYFFYFKNVPGPTPLPILGNALSFQNNLDVLPKLLEFNKEYGSFFTFYIGYQAPSIVTTDPKFLNFLLSSNVHITKSPEYDFMKNWLGTGLLTSTGSLWKLRRKIVTPAFHFKILEQFLEIFKKNAEIMLEIWDKEVETNIDFDVYPYVKLLTLDVICESSLGIEINAQIDKNSVYVQSVEIMGRILMERAMSPLLYYDFFYKLSKKWREERKALEIVQHFTNLVIQRRRQKVESEGENLGKNKKLAFLDLLLKAEVDGKRLSDDDIRDEVNTFMFEGHDTTGSGIGFCLYTISQHQHVQEQIIEELNNIIDKNNGTIHFSYSDLQEMKYLDAVVKESLRLYPPIAMIGRELSEDVLYNNMKIPKHANITIFSYGMLRDPKLFPEPEKFKPERFLYNNSGLEYNSFTYIPFSAGPRNCIGQKYAMLEMKSTIAEILLRFKIKPADNDFKLALTSEIVMKSSSGIKIKIEKRK